MKLKIGDCNFCDRKNTPIAAGWTTRDKKCCTYCLAKKTAKRLSEKRALKAAQQPQREIAKVCYECGVSGVILDVSHVLSKGAHPELSQNPLNLVEHCRPCHMRWENPKDLTTRMAMNTYIKKRAWIMQHRKPADYE